MPTLRTMAILGILGILGDLRSPLARCIISADGRPNVEGLVILRRAKGLGIRAPGTEILGSGQEHETETPIVPR